MISGIFHRRPAERSACHPGRTVDADERASASRVVCENGSELLVEGPHAALRAGGSSHRAIVGYRAGLPDSPITSRLTICPDPADSPAVSMDSGTWPRTEWALAILGDDGTTLTLVSDPFGTYPLYYADTGPVVFWSTSLEWVLARIETRTLSDHYLAALLTSGVPAELTPWREVRALLPSHVRRFERTGRPRDTLYWRPDLVPVDSISAEDGAVMLRDALLTSVEDRLGLGGPVWFELSGGLDSSTLACFAAIGHGSDPTNGGGVVTYLDDDSPEDTEAPFVEAARNRCGLRYVPLESGGLPLLASQRWAMPDPRSGAHEQLERLLPAGPDALLISGRFGDAAMMNRLICPDALLSTWRHLGTRACAHRLLESAVVARTTVWQEIARTWSLIMPAAIRRRHARQAWVRGARPKRRHEHDYFTPRLYELIGEFTPETLSLPDLPEGVVEKRLLLDDFRTAITLRLYSNRDWRGPVRLSYPFLDPRLLETILRLPSHLFTEPQTPRHLMRAAIDGVVPDRIRLRRGKSFAAPVVSRRLRRYANGFAGRLLVVERGLVEGTVLRRAVARLSRGAHTSLGSLRAVLLVENWLRHLEGVEQITARDARSNAA